MEKLSKDLIKKLNNINKNISDNYKDILKDKNQIRKSLDDLSKIKTLQKADLSNIDARMLVIDGSVNRIGGIYPHYIDIYQGYGLLPHGEDIIFNEVYTPLLDNISDDKGIRDKMLAGIEVDVAIEGALNCDINIIIMDGGLIRHQIENEEKFKELVKICKNKNISLIGFIKEIKTYMLYPYLLDNDVEYPIYDKDLLYGIFEKGEAFIIPNSINKKYIETSGNICSGVFRLSNHPRVTGIDVLNDQSHQIDHISNICYTLTPDMSRGVPIIIDIVDKKATISDKMASEIISTYLDRDVYERFFVNERNLRN